MRIGELAKQTGFKQSSIRFYEKEGLMPDAQRTINGYRRYDEHAINRLTQIKFCKHLGFSLDDMKQILTIDKGLNHEAVMTKLASRKQETKHLIQELEQNLENIRNLESRLKQLWQEDRCMEQAELTHLLNKANL